MVRGAKVSARTGSQLVTHRVASMASQASKGGGMSVKAEKLDVPRPSSAVYVYSTGLPSAPGCLSRASVMAARNERSSRSSPVKKLSA